MNKFLTKNLLPIYRLSPGGIPFLYRFMNLITINVFNLTLSFLKFLISEYVRDNLK